MKMKKGSLRLAPLFVSSIAFSALALGQTTPENRAPSPAHEEATSQLFGRIWRITNAPSPPAAGSIYIFLANGTLLETSCVETYRVAAWTRDPKSPGVLHIIEDKRPAFSAIIQELTPSTLRLEQTLTQTHEQREITLTAIDSEFVCSDLPK